jgi:hypothetical protein
MHYPVSLDKSPIFLRAYVIEEVIASFRKLAKRQDYGA